MFYLLDFSLLWMERNFDKGVTFSHEIHLWEVLWHKETKTEKNEVDERDRGEFDIERKGQERKYFI